MNKTFRLIAVIAAVSLIATGAFAAKGNLKIAGSTTVLPLSQLWAEQFMLANPNASISLTGGGTGVGLTGLLNGTCDIANASREAKAKEIATARERNTKLVATRCAKDGLAIIVHPSNNVKNLTMDQIQAIYSGKLNNWNEAGGDSKSPIVAVGRDSSSGTYGFFQEAVLDGRAYRKDMLSMPTNQGVAQAVSQSKDAIGYVGMAYAWQYADKGKVKVLFVSRKKGEAGMAPNDENVKSGVYPLFRYLYMYTSGKPKGLAAEFIKYCLSPEGQTQVTKAGYLPVK